MGPKPSRRPWCKVSLKLAFESPVDPDPAGGCYEMLIPSEVQDQDPDSINFVVSTHTMDFIYDDARSMIEFCRNACSGTNYVAIHNENCFCLNEFSQLTPSVGNCDNVCDDQFGLQMCGGEHSDASNGMRYVNLYKLDKNTKMSISETYDCDEFLLRELMAYDQTVSFGGSGDFEVSISNFKLRISDDSKSAFCDDSDLVGKPDTLNFLKFPGIKQIEDYKFLILDNAEPFHRKLDYARKCAELDGTPIKFESLEELDRLRSLVRDQGGDEIILPINGITRKWFDGVIVEPHLVQCNPEEKRYLTVDSTVGVDCWKSHEKLWSTTESKSFAYVCKNLPPVIQTSLELEWVRIGHNDDESKKLITDDQFKFTRSGDIIGRCKDGLNNGTFYSFDPVKNMFQFNFGQLQSTQSKVIDYDVAESQIFALVNDSIIYERPVSGFPNFTDFSMSDVKQFATYQSHIIISTRIDSNHLIISPSDLLYKMYKSYPKTINTGIFDVINSFDRTSGFLCSKDSHSQKIQGVCGVNIVENRFEIGIIVELDHSRYTVTTNGMLQEDRFGAEPVFRSLEQDVSSDYFLAPASSPEMQIVNGELFSRGNNLGHPEGEEFVKLYKIPNGIIAKSWTNRIYSVNNEGFYQLSIQNEPTEKLSKTDFFDHTISHGWVRQYKAVHIAPKGRFPSTSQNLYVPTCSEELTKLRNYLNASLTADITFFVGFDGFSWTQSLTDLNPSQLADNSIDLNEYRTSTNVIPALKFSIEDRSLRWKSVPRNSEHYQMVQFETAKYKSCPLLESVKDSLWYVSEVTEEAGNCLFVLVILCEQTKHFIMAGNNEFECYLKASKQNGVVDLEPWFADTALVLYENGVLKAKAISEFQSGTKVAMKYQMNPNEEVCGQDYSWDEELDICHKVSSDIFSDFKDAQNHCEKTQATLGVANIRHIPDGRFYWSENGLTSTLKTCQPTIWYQNTEFHRKSSVKYISADETLVIKMESINCTKMSANDCFWTISDYKEPVPVFHGVYCLEDHHLVTSVLKYPENGPAFCVKPKVSSIQETSSEKTQYVRHQTAFPTRSVLDEPIPKLETTVDAPFCPVGSHRYGKKCYFASTNVASTTYPCDRLNIGGFKFDRHNAKVVKYSPNFLPGLKGFLLRTFNEDTLKLDGGKLYSGRRGQQLVHPEFTQRVAASCIYGTQRQTKEYCACGFDGFDFDDAIDQFRGYVFDEEILDITISVEECLEQVKSFEFSGALFSDGVCEFVEFDKTPSLRIDESSDQVFLTKDQVYPRVSLNNSHVQIQTLEFPSTESCFTFCNLVSTCESWEYSPVNETCRLYGKPADKLRINTSEAPYNLIGNSGIYCKKTIQEKLESLTLPKARPTINEDFDARVVCEANPFTRAVTPKTHCSEIYSELNSETMTSVFQFQESCYHLMPKARNVELLREECTFGLGGTFVTRVSHERATFLKRVLPDKWVWFDQPENLRLNEADNVVNFFTKQSRSISSKSGVAFGLCELPRIIRCDPGFRYNFSNKSCEGLVPIEEKLDHEQIVDEFDSSVLSYETKLILAKSGRNSNLGCETALFYSLFKPLVDITEINKICEIPELEDMKMTSKELVGQLENTIYRFNEINRLWSILVIDGLEKIVANDDYLLVLTTTEFQVYDQSNNLLKTVDRNQMKSGVTIQDVAISHTNQFRYLSNGIIYDAINNQEIQNVTNFSPESIDYGITGILWASNGSILYRIPENFPIGDSQEFEFNSTIFLMNTQFGGDPILTTAEGIYSVNQYGEIISISDETYLGDLIYSTHVSQVDIKLAESEILVDIDRVHLLEIRHGIELSGVSDRNPHQIISVESESYLLYKPKKLIRLKEGVEVEVTTDNILEIMKIFRFQDKRYIILNCRIDHFGNFSCF